MQCDGKYKKGGEIPRLADQLALCRGQSPARSAAPATGQSRGRGPRGRTNGAVEGAWSGNTVGTRGMPPALWQDFGDLALHAEVSWRRPAAATANGRASAHARTTSCCGGRRRG